MAEQEEVSGIKLSRRDFLKGLSGVAAGVVTAKVLGGAASGPAVARAEGQAQIPEPFKRYDMEGEKVGFEAPAGQVLTKEDGTELSVYSQAKMKEGDKIYDLQAPAGVSLRGVREKLGWGFNSGDKVVIVTKNGIVEQIKFKDKIWP